MLVLSRKCGEKILLPNIGTSLEVISVRGSVVRLGVVAPQEIVVLRGELTNREKSNDLLAELVTHRDTNHHMRGQMHATQIGLHTLQKRLHQSDPDVQNTLRCMCERFEEVGAASALVVEDNSNERELLIGLLRLYGFQVAGAKDGSAAMKYLHAAETVPDFVLLDMNLPNVSGEEVVRSIRASFTDRMRVFVISGRQPQPLLGVDSWFQKPLDPEKLIRVLRTA